MPVPPSFDVTALVVLDRAPVAVPVTFTEKLHDAQLELPSFVRIGGNANVQGFSGSGGYLGNDYDPFMMALAGTMPTNDAS